MQLRTCRGCSIVAETEEDLEIFEKDSRLPYGRANYCQACRRGYKSKRRAANLVFIKELTGLKCSHCAFTHTSTVSFDWHHINPTYKEANISHLLSDATRVRLVAEIAKCIFLCKNCHAIEHERLRREKNEFITRSEGI